MFSGEDSKTDPFKIKSSEFSFFALFLKPMKLCVHCLIFLNKNLSFFGEKSMITAIKIEVLILVDVLCMQIAHW